MGLPQRQRAADVLRLHRQPRAGRARSGAGGLSRQADGGLLFGLSGDRGAAAAARSAAGRAQAHARRKVFEARESYPVEAAIVLAKFQQLYDVETRGAETSAENRPALRRPKPARLGLAGAWLRARPRTTCCPAVSSARRWGISAITGNRCSCISATGGCRSTTTTSNN